VLAPRHLAPRKDLIWKKLLGMVSECVIHRKLSMLAEII
jgi:hypothetical protein